MNKSKTPNLRLRLIAVGLGLALLLGAVRIGAPVSADTFDSRPQSIGQSPSQSDEDWDHRFAPPGVNGSIGAIAASGNYLYVGGLFSKAGGIEARNIARWDTVNEQWSTLGPGLNGSVSALVVKGNYLYVGGGFPNGPNTTYVARWDMETSQWSSIGDITGGVVISLAMSETGTLYVGGNFSGAGGVSAHNIAMWDSNTGEWSKVGSGSQNGTSGNVNAIAAIGGAVYVGGTFSQAGGVSASRVALWNSDAGQWSALGSGVNNTVEGIAAHGSDLYVGGTFTSAGGVAVSRIARWNSDTGQWYDVGGGMSGTYGLVVRGLGFGPGGDLYAGGVFSQAGGVSAINIARWDGNSWHAVGEGVPFSGSRIEVLGSTIYAGGYTSGGNDPSAISAWDGERWKDLGEGLNNWVYAVASDGSGNTYVGGDFSEAGGISAAHVAKWDGSTWSALGTGLEGSPVFAIVVADNYVYVGGSFALAGGLAANNIARWNTATGEWSTLGAGIQGEVRALAVSGRDLYVAGYFNRAGDINANNIAKWNMDTGYWSPLGAGIGNSTYHIVVSLAVNGSYIYAGGTFTVAGGNSANNIARWDSSTGEWSPLGSGVTRTENPSVFAIEVIGNDIYAGGAFTTAGGSAANNIARWNGSQWSPLGTGIGDRVYSMDANDIDLYVSGSFQTAGGLPANSVAHWDAGTSQWSALGSGTNGGTGAIDARINGIIYVGGSFNTAGNKPSANFGAWHYEYQPPPRCRGERFTDVCPDDFFYTPVQELSQANIISGYNGAPPCDNARHIPCFWPFSNITRGQVAKIVSLAAGFGEPVSGQSFEDVPPSNTFYTFIERMASRGIIGGYPCGGVGEPCGSESKPYFRWGADVTRGQLSKMVAQAFGYIEPISGQTFQDVPTSNVFYSYIGRMASRGIITGYPCDSNAQEPCIAPDNRPYFRPNNSVTRGQTSKMVYLSRSQPTPTVTGTPPTATATHTATTTPTSTPTSTPACGLYWHVVPGSSVEPVGTEFHDLAIVSTQDVWAVGSSAPRPGITMDTSLIMHWDGAAWSVSANFIPGALFSVDAISPNDVWAVGTAGIDLTLIMHWDGNVWSQVGSPGGYLYSVSGVASNDVWAVGSAPSSGGGLLLHWDGTAWSSVQSPMPGTYLSGVEALSSDDVWAVGQSGGYTLTLHWEGSTWSVVSSPSVPAASNALLGISAVAPNDVWAVGTYQGTGAQDPQRTLTLHWNGSWWSIVLSPNPAPTSSSYRNSLNGVAALSANDVWAVGFYETGQQSPFRRTIILHWDGTTWNLASSADPGAGANVLYGVEAISPVHVWAVGFQSVYGATSLVERYYDPCAPPTPSSLRRVRLHLWSGKTT